MFQLERLKVVNETLEQISEEITEGRVGDIYEMDRKVMSCIDTLTRIHIKLQVRKTISEEETDEDS